MLNKTIDKTKVDFFLMTNAKYFPPSQIMMVKDRLEKMDDDKFVFVQTLNFKDNTTALLLGILLSADRIYLGQVGLGILKILSVFIVIGWIWWLVDLFSISRRTQEYNMNEFNKLIMFM